jgi:hypothetical protein
MATKKTDSYKSIAADYGWSVKALKELLEPIMPELEKMRGKRKGKKKRHRIIIPKIKLRIYEFLGEPGKT